MLKPIRSIVCSSERSATTMTASVEDTARSSWDDVDVGAQGTTTAPIFHAPRTASSQSTVLPDMTITRSPGETLFSRSAVAHTAAPSAISMNERCSMTPSDPRNVSARRLGSRAERLDDVAREVEAVGYLPAAVDERRPKGELERRARRLVPAPAALADAKTFHGLGIIDPNRR